MRWTLVALGVLLSSACEARAPTGADYATHCVSMMVRKSGQDPVWRGSRAALVEPVLVEAGPPAIVRCAAELRDGEIVTFDITARCQDGLLEHCSAPRG